MVKEVEELIKIVGKGNLLEALFIFLGGFQHADLDHSIDYRNHLGLSAFIRKKEEPLDEYFNLKFSLQRLFLICTQVYKILSGSNDLSAQGVIDEIRKVIKDSELGKDINEVVNGRKLDLLNILANPKGELTFKTEGDFENKVLIGVRELLSEENALNEYDREFALNKCIIDFYYSIHQGIKVDRDVALLFSIGSDYKKLSPYNKTIKKEVLDLSKNPLMIPLVSLAKMLKCIDLQSKNGSTKYMLNCEGIGGVSRTFNMLANQNNQDFLTFKSIGPILKQLLKKQDSDEFEQLVTNPENIHYSVPQKENECKPSFIISKKNHKNTFYKLALGMFILSVGLYVADYFLMEQR